MAVGLMLLALLPAFYGVMVTGDFSQYVYKPTREQVYFVLRNRTYLIGASLLLWIIGFIWHLYFTPTNVWVIIVSGLLLILFLIAGFMMSGYILFRAIIRPRWISATEADNQLSPDEPVIGLDINGDARAYPVDSVLRPHLVHDTVGGEKVTLSFCMLSNSAMAYKPEFEGKEQHFITPMQWENNMMFYDASNGHLVQQLTGRIVSGPDDNKPLSSFPTRIMPWDSWKQLHPVTKVLYHPPGFLFDKLVRFMLKTQIYEPNLHEEKVIFPTINHFDSRLPNKEEVLGVSVQDASKAYPVTYLQQQNVINDNLKEMPLLVAYDPNLDIGDVFDRRHDGKVLTFHAEGGADETFFLVDEETESKWNILGEAIDGSLQGNKLAPYPHFNRVFWFSWVNFFPDTDVAS